MKKIEFTDEQERIYLEYSRDVEVMYYGSLDTHHNLFKDAKDAKDFLRAIQDLAREQSARNHRNKKNGVTESKVGQIYAIKYHKIEPLKKLILATNTYEPKNHTTLFRSIYLFNGYKVLFTVGEYQDCFVQASTGEWCNLQEVPNLIDKDDIFYDDRNNTTSVTDYELHSENDTCDFFIAVDATLEGYGSWTEYGGEWGERVGMDNFDDAELVLDDVKYGGFGEDGDEFTDEQLDIIYNLYDYYN